MTQASSSAGSFPYLLLFSGSYLALVVIAQMIGPALPQLAVISLMILVLPAWVAASRFLRVEGRAPTLREAAKLAIASFLIALIVDLLVVSLALKMQRIGVADQLSRLQQSLSATVASDDFWLFASVILGLSVLKVLCLGMVYWKIDSGKSPRRA